MQKFKFFTLAIITMLSVNLAWGEGAETFENCTNSTSYGSVSWTGDNGLSWSASSFRTDQKITGSHGLTTKASTACTITMPLTSTQQSAGMGTFTFKYKYPYSDSGKSNNLSFTINGHSYSGTVSYNSSAQTVNITVNESSLPSSITINIASGGRACFDDFSWTSNTASTYTVSYELGGGTHGTNHPTSGTIGTAFAVSAPTRSNYTFTGWTVTSGLNTTTAKWGTTSSPSTSLTSSSTKCVNGTSDVYFKDLGSANGSVTLTANWQEKAKYTVTFNAGSGTCGTASLTEASAGAGVTLPAALPSSACGTDGWTFAGWAAASQAETTTAPTLYAANSNYKPSSNCTLYAVYSKTEGGSVAELTKLGSSATFSAGDNIVVVASADGDKLMYQETISTSYVKYESFDGKLSTIQADDKRYWTLSKGTDNGTWILGDETNGYLNVSSNNLYCNDDQSDWTITWVGTENKFSIKCGTRWLSCRSDLTGANQYKWRGGGTTTTYGTVYLDIYKYTVGSGTTTYNSNPSCATCTNLITITKGTPSHGSFTLTGAGTDICADEPVTVSLSNITAADHYHATAVTSSNGGTPSAITDGSATVTGITASTTINVTFDEDTKVVVTLLNNNNPVNAGGFDAQGKKEYYTGETLGTLPTLTSTDACDATSVTFKGWTTEQITTKRAAAPDFVDADTQVNAAMTLRAVWARAE